MIDIKNDSSEIGFIKKPFKYHFYTLFLFKFDEAIKEVSNSDNDMTFSHQIKSNLTELAKNYDKIMTFINNDKSMNDDIIIELPVYRATIRINNVVWGNFKDFWVQNKMFTQRDLLSRVQ